MNATTASASGTSALAANAWSHVAFTFDGTSLRLYVNGTLVRTTNASGSIAATTGQLLVGSDSAAWYRGRLDDLRIYNRALTAAQIPTDSATPVP